jgi:hypothetical protein
LWHRLRGWWVLAAAAVLSAVAQQHTGMAAAVLGAVGLAVLGVVAERGRAQLGTPQRTAGLLATRVSRLDDPLRLGAHRAAALDGNQVPPFVARDLLPDLVEALGKGGFVLVVGDSTAGKTRLAYEAMRACLPSHVCVSPDGPHSLRAALTAAKVHRPSVLWLDDLERYLGRQWPHVDRPRRSQYSRTGDDANRGLARAGRELLDAMTTELHLDRMWSGHELAAAAHTHPIRASPAPSSPQTARHRRTTRRRPGPGA